MRRDEETLTVAAETLGVAPGPGDGAAHLLIHRKQIAAGLLHIDEIENDRMRAGTHQRFGLQVIIGPFVAPPSPAVNENVDRRAPALRQRRAEDIEPLVFARSVGDALRRAQACPW